MLTLVMATTTLGTAFTYLVVSYLPHALVDLCLSIQDRLYGVYLSHVRTLMASGSRRWSRLQTPASSRPPLPTPPATSTSTSRLANPLRPGPAQVPLADPFVPSTAASSSASWPSSSSSANGDGDELSSSGSGSGGGGGSESSLEDFGPIGGSGPGTGTGYGTASMGGSFVSVGRDDY